MLALFGFHLTVLVISFFVFFRLCGPYLIEGMMDSGNWAEARKGLEMERRKGKKRKKHTQEME